MSKIKVNEIENRTGSTLTLGKSGTTIQLACGATQTGFGRTGTVNWCTTAKTSPFTATNGSGFFVNTTSGSVTVTLPSSPSAGSILAICDYASTFDSNSVTVCRAGSKINGSCNNAYLSTKGSSTTFVYVDGTRGWKLVNDATENTTGEAAAFVAASGGTETTSGDFKIHTFTSNGTFTVTNGGNVAGSSSVDYLVIAGGGGGGGSNYSGAGGGAGGYRFSNGTVSGCYAAGPAPLGASALPVSAQTYPITIGAGGAGGTYPGPQSGTAGNPSIFSTITSTGGGQGAGGNGAQGGTGGSGGGNSGDGSPNPTVAAGNTPPVSPPQGFPGGLGTGCGPAFGAGGGGGASEAGNNGTSSPPGGTGGDGLASSITGSPVTRGGGGGGGIEAGGDSPGGAGGGGKGTGSTGCAGTANTGGGGGGAGNSPHTGGAGGSGIVVIRYKFQ